MCCRIDRRSLTNSMTPQPVWLTLQVSEFVLNDPHKSNSYQNQPVGVVRKDRLHADVFGIDDRQNPGGLFFYCYYYY